MQSLSKLSLVETTSEVGNLVGQQEFIQTNYNVNAVQGKKVELQKKGEVEFAIPEEVNNRFKFHVLQRKGWVLMKVHRITG